VDEASTLFSETDKTFNRESATLSYANQTSAFVDRIGRLQMDLTIEQQGFRLPVLTTDAR
jgi:hypothetical protein